LTAGSKRQKYIGKALRLLTTKKGEYF